MYLHNQIVYHFDFKYKTIKKKLSFVETLSTDIVYTACISATSSSVADYLFLRATQIQRKLKKKILLGSKVIDLICQRMFYFVD